MQPWEPSFFQGYIFHYIPKLGYEKHDYLWDNLIFPLKSWGFPTFSQHFSRGGEEPGRLRRPGEHLQRHGGARHQRGAAKRSCGLRQCPGGLVDVQIGSGETITVGFFECLEIT